MSSTIYNKAFDIQLTHEFFTDAHRFRVNEQLQIFPLASTSDLMKKGRMRLVRTGSGLSVFYQAYLDSAPAIPVVKPLIELTGNLEFIFAFTIKGVDNQFQNTTFLDYGGTYSSGNILLLDGEIPPPVPPGAGIPVSIDLDPSLVSQLRPAVFTYTFLPDTPGQTNDLTVKVYPKNVGTPVLTINSVPVDPSTGIYSVQLDLRNQPKGIYTIKADDSGSPEHEADVYVDSDISGQNVFGLIRLTYTDPAYFYQGMPDTISCEFEARAVNWRYYVAIKSVPAGFFTNHTLSIVDTSAVHTFTPLDGGGIPNGTVKINGQDTVIFTSAAPITFSEVAIGSINLIQNNPVNPVKPLMNVLANATTGGVDSNQVGVAGENYAEIFLFLEQVSDP